MDSEATAYGDVDDPATKFNARTRRRRRRRQTQQWKNVIDAAQNGDLSAVRRYIEEQRVDVNSSLPGNTGNLLSAAAQEGHIDIVRYLISRGANVNAKDRYGYNPLLWVLDKNKTKLDVIQLLVENGADVNVQAKENGYTPLHWAVIHNRLDVVQYLVAMNADLNSRTTEGLTAIEEASKRRLTDILVYLTNTLNRFGGNTSTDIFEAATKGDLNAVRYYVESERKDPFAYNSSGETALHMAAANGRLPVVKYLLEMKSRNVNLANANGESPLISATQRGQLSVMQYLIADRHANPDAVDRAGYTPLLLAARLGNVEAVKYLVSRGNTKATDRDFSNNVLHIASQYGYSNVIAFLVDEKRWNIYAKNKYGDTALHIAARYGHLPIVRYFIDDKGMEYTLTDARGRNVLHAAVEGGSLDVVKYLLDEKHADIMSKDSSQNTILHIAVESDHLELVKHLIEVRGLSPTTPNGYGSSAAMLAQTYSRTQILSYFVYERGVTTADLTNTSGGTHLNSSSKPANDKPPLANPLTIINVGDSSSKYTQKPASYDNSYWSSAKLPTVKPPTNSVNVPSYTKPVVKPDEPFLFGPPTVKPPTNSVDAPSYTKPVVKPDEPFFSGLPTVKPPTNTVDIPSYSQPVIKPNESFIIGPQFNFQTTRETIEGSDGMKTVVKQHYLINGKEVDKSTMDKAIMDFMKASAAFNNSSGSRVTWGQETMTDVNGTRTIKYIVNGQEASQEYYESIVKQYGSGNPNSVSSMFTSSSGTQFAPQQYYSSGRRRRRSVNPSKSETTLSKVDPSIATGEPLRTPSSWLPAPTSKSSDLPTTSAEGRINSVTATGVENLSSKFGVDSNVHNFLTLFNFTMNQVRGNRFPYQPRRHESLMSRKEIIENRIDYDAINSVNGFYNF